MIQTSRVGRVAQVLPSVASGEVLPFALGLLRIQHLHPGSGAEALSLLQAWQETGLYGVVVDLRGADGEDLESVEVIGGALAKAGDVLFAFRDGADQDVQVVLATGGALRFPIMVLVDEETGGAAEVLAAVLRDSVRGAMVFGQPTRGDFLLREAVEVSPGMSYQIATRRLVTGDGTVYTGRGGVRPDVMVMRQETGATDFRAERSRRRQVVEEEVEQQKLHVRTRGDAALRRAVDVLLGLKALDIRPHSRVQP
jgi:carboxyl-terminal processing protease